jgi:hypothetical protein
MSTNAFHYLLWALWLVPAVLIFFHCLDDMKRGTPQWKSVQEGMKEVGWSKGTQLTIIFVCVAVASLLWPITMVYGLFTGAGKKK